MARSKTQKPTAWASAFLSLWAAVLLASPPAAAVPLEPEACASLSSERTQLIGNGVEADMAKGAAWARQNLAEDRLALIKRLIEVNEQLSFRCGIMVTERPTLIQRMPPPRETLATTTPDGAEKPKKQTKSKPKAASPPPPGVPGSKPKQQPNEASAAAKKPKTEPTGETPLNQMSAPVSAQGSAPMQKQAPVEKAGN